MQRIPNASGESLTGFIAGHIVPGGEIRTDGWSGYNQLVCHGYTHLVFRLLQNAVACPPLPAKEIELGLGSQPRRKARLTAGLRVEKVRRGTNPPPLPLAAIPGFGVQPALPF